jgi:hypothetical protein
MKMLIFGAILTACAAFSNSALAYDCDEGFKGHMEKMQIFINRVDGYTLVRPATIFLLTAFGTK